MPLSLDARVGLRVYGLRRERSWSIDALAQASGVSRSMISLIERGESSATAVVLDKLATALGVTLASLFDPPSAAASPLSRRAAQPVWRDAASGYQRRQLSPGAAPAPLRLVEVEFPPGAQVAFETGAREAPFHQQVWLVDGQIEITLGDAVHRLEAGDCLAMHVDQPVRFHNPGSTPARYLVALVVPAGPAATAAPASARPRPPARP